MLYSSFLYRTFKLSAKKSSFASIYLSFQWDKRYRELETKTKSKGKSRIFMYTNHRNLIQNFLEMIWGQLECSVYTNYEGSGSGACGATLELGKQM